MKSAHDCWKRWRDITKISEYEWDKKSDEKLLRLVKTREKNWHTFSKYFNGLDSKTIRNRYNKLIKAGEPELEEVIEPNESIPVENPQNQMSTEAPQDPSPMSCDEKKRYHKIVKDLFCEEWGHSIQSGIISFSEEDSVSNANYFGPDR